MSNEIILVAGAGGKAGSYIVPILQERGYTVRLLTRTKSRLQKMFPQAEIVEADVLKPESLRGACAGVSAVISTIGASLDLNNFRDKRSFHEVDYCGNQTLLQEAVSAKVGTFVYLSAFGAETTRTAYTDEHEAFVGELRRSPLDYKVVRPTGFFYINAEFVKMAQRGRAVVIGDGKARTNPIHEEDVAKACVDALEGQAKSINIGGAETFTRKEIVELAFEACGKPPKISHVPFGVMRVASTLARPLNRRLSELVEFGAVVATQDCVAPAVQTHHRLEAYFRGLTAEKALTHS